jgi:DNA-binding response OmpR family regulator
MHKILVIEDDPAIARALSASLEREHYDVRVFNDGEQGYKAALIQTFDVILLDLILPGKDGEDICKSLRANAVSTPILMLTSKGREIDKVQGLEIGADDYVTKPFSLLELNARIKALLRRRAELRKEPETYSFGDVFVDFTRREVTKDGEQMKFSNREFDVLRHFILHEGEIVTRDNLLDAVWGYETFPTTRTVDNFILSIRKKIERDFSEPQHLLTVHAAGYKFQQ